LSQTLNLVSVTLSGCQSTTFSTASTTVIVTPNNTVSANSGVQSLCINSSLTTINLVTTGATGIGIPTGLPAGVSANWAANTITISGTPTAAATFNYSIPLTGGCGSVNATGTIVVNALPSVNAGADQAICIGSSTTLTATNALTYNWGSGTQSSGNFVVNPTTSTTYSVSGTDNNGCSNTDQVVVTVSPIPANPTVTSNTVTYCQNQAASPLTATGSSLKWYTVSNGGTGSTTAPTPSTTSTGTTSYFVSQTINGCESARAQIDVVINSLPTIFISGNGTICAGNNTTLTASGGNGTFTWNGGLGTTNSITVAPSTNTTYTVNGTGTNGCIGTATTNVIVNQLPIISGGANQTICAGASVTLSGSGGNPGSYIWSGSILNNTPFNPTTTTTYTVTGQGANGCSNTASVLVTVNSNPAAPLLTPTHPNCTTNTGSIQFSGLPSTGWTINPGSINGSGANYPLNSLASGPYTFTVRDSNLCTSASSSIIINPAPAPTNPPTAVAQSFMAAANPTVLDLSITSSGTPVWYTVPTGGLALSSSTPLSSGTYHAAQIVNGCESGARTSVAVTVNANSVGGSVSSDALVCIGTNSTTLTLSGQTGNVIKWQSANNINFTGTVVDISNTNTTYVVTNINTPTYYRAVVQSGTSTSFSTPAFIDIIPQSVSGSITPSTSTVCSGQNSGLLTLSGYLGSIIRWEESTNGSTWNPISNTNSTFISGALTQTTYFRAVVQNSGCAIVTTTNVVVSINSTPTISPVNLSACVGNNSTLTASTTPATTNAWQSSNPGIATISATGLVTAVSPGTTLITYTNSNGCTATANFVVNVPPTLFITNPAPVCSPNTVNLTSSNITLGSTPGLFFSYYTNSLATLTLTNNTAVATSGTYYIKGTDANGCSTSVNPVSVLINTLPTYTITGTSTICAGSSTTLTSSSANSYSWSNGLGTTSSITVTPLTTTTYTVTGTDNNGCAGTGTYTVTVNPLPNVNAGSDRIICLGSSVTLTGAGAANYTWNSGIPNGNPFTPSTTSTYTVTGTDANNCSNTDSVLVTVNSIPATPTIIATQPNCTSSIATIQFSGLPTPNPGNWTINPGAYTGNTSTFTLNSQPAGNYNFTVTDNNSCTSAVSPITIIAVPTIPTAPIVGTPTQPSCLIPTGSVVLSGLPTGTWTITKSPGGETYTATGSNYTVTNLASGTYTFTVSNGTCSSSASTNVVINAVPIQSEPIVGLLVQPTCTVTTGSVTLNGLPSTGSWTLTRIPDGVTLTNSGNTRTISGLVPGTYYYTVTNSNGCTSVSSTSIVIDPQPASPIAPVANPQTFLVSENATVSNLQIVGGATATWYSNSVISTPLAISTLLTTGVYYVTQTVNGCESSNRTAVNVTVFPNSAGGIVNGGAIVCFGTNSTVLTLTGQTGTVIKWQSASDVNFTSSLVDITNTSTSYTVTNTTTPLYYRAVVQSGTAPIEYSNPAFIDVTSQSLGGNLSSATTSICKNENSGLITLTGNNGAIIRWEQSTDNGFSWLPITNTSNTYISGALTTTTQYRAVVQNGVCPAVYSSVVTITVKSTPVINDIPNQQVCFGDTKTFGEPFIAGYTYNWTSDIGYSSVLPQVNITFNQVVTQNYTYTITNDLTGCAVQDQFQIVVNPLPNATVIADTTICAGDSIAIGANSVVGSTYSWSSIPAGYVSTSSNPIPGVSPAVTTTYILEETVTATGCKKSNPVTITVQPTPVITIVGAPEFHICETTSQVQLNATATNSTTIVWSTLIGSGSFNNNTILNPIYSPSFADISSGSVTLLLTVTGINPCITTYTETVKIIIDRKPIANAGLDVITCGTNPIQINANGTQYATNLVWSIPSGITGTLNQGNPFMPIYTPSASDQNYVGPIDFTLTASSSTTCPSSTDTVSVLITPAPKVDAGPPSATICEGSNYFVPSNPLAGQNIVNNTILWTNGTGDGTIVGANTLTPTYIPGPNDIINESVTLTLSAAGNNPCSTPATDSIIINIVKKPVVNVGPPTTVCEGPVTINSSIQNAGTILWTSSGNGTFINPTASSPIYNPAVSDLNTIVTFSVEVTPINNCGQTFYDSVLYTINKKPSIVVGGNATICESNPTFNLNATTSNTTPLTWTSTGSGSFDNINNEDPIYTLSPADKDAGSVTFTLTGVPSIGCTATQDSMVLTIQKNPTADAGLAQVICQGESVVLPGSSSNSSGFSWTRSSGTGSFLNDNTATPTYNSQVSEQGTIYLTFIANAIAPCTIPAYSNTTITIIPKAIADAGLDHTICEGESYQITTATSPVNSGVQWSSSGDGTFTGANTLNPIYTPGTNDNNSGSVRLTLVAYKEAPCFANAVDEMTLFIKKIPVITVINPDVDLCVGDPFYIINGVVPTNYDTLSWSTSGSGTFSPNNSALAPTYFPSASDYTLGTVTLTLTAARDPLNCNSSTSNTVTLHFISPPIAEAGPASATICEGASYVTNGTTTSANYSNVTWSTSGTGTFTNATTLLATYTPSQADIDLGFVDLTLTANPLSPCAAPDTDVIRLNLQKLPVITLAATDAICVTQNSYGIGGTTVTDYAPNSIVWTTSGTGTFAPSGDPLNPIYNPSNTDLALPFVNLTLTVNSIAPCAVPVSSTLKLSFQKLPVASAGPNLTRCALPFQITGSTVDLATVDNLVWSTSGTGTFDFTNIIDPIYTPSAADILSVNPIRLTLTANPMAPCAVPLVTFTDVTLIKEPIITVVTPQPTICADETSVLVTGTVIQNATNSYNWTSTTGTTILNSTSLTPLVTPSSTDIDNEYIDITITAFANAPCSTNATKTVRIPVQKKPSVTSGASQTLCEGSTITTSDAIATNVTNLQWDNNGGDGTFTSSNLNTIVEYTPGPNEIQSGQVLLTLNGTAIAPCTGTVSSTTVYTIVKNPIVTINPTEVTICETDTYTIPANYITIVNPTSILSHQWTTPDMSSITGASSWTPTYTPTPADIAATFVNLTLTVTPIAPCADPIVRTFKINIVKKATIDATQTNYTFCENTPKQLSAIFANHDASTIQWQIVSGAGTLSASNTANPIFTPDASSTTVVIQVSASSISPCTLVATQQFTLNVIKKPIVSFANTSATICNTQTSYPLNGNTVANATASTTYLWTTTGTGTFANNTALVTTYNFSAADLNSNSVTLRLLAKSDAICALTDFEEITINITKAPTVTTAPNDTVCQDSVFTASATATNAASILWSTVGTSNGTFTLANQLVSQYTQGSNDTNSFTIQITANGNAPCAAVSATKVVTVQKKPILDAGLENRFSCSSLPYQITGVTGDNLGTVLWTSNSANPGTFSNSSVLNPIYTPSAAEIAGNTPIILTVTAQAVAPCTGTVTDFIILNLTPNQVVNAGLNQTICEDDEVSLVGSAINASSVYWTSTGTGTFSAVNSLTTNYTPSSFDINFGSVTLTLHAISNSNCPEEIDETEIIIKKKPTANAGAPVSICEGSSYTLSAGEATAANFTSVTWTATGPGAIDVTTINTLTPKYIPALGQTGTVTLTLTATGHAACGINAVSQKTITIVPKPIVTVISTKTICQGDTFTISNTDASAINFASLLWSSSNGLGTFTPNNAAATIYTPATGQTGLVTLTLTATSANGVCPNSTDNILLDIIAKPIVEAGNNGTICQTGTYTVTGANVQNHSSYSWSVIGQATIQAGTETTLSPVIVPNAGASGIITVTLTAIGTGNCSVSESDSLTIQINPAPVVNAGTDGFLCEGTGSFQLNGTGSNADTYSWTTTGGGFIQSTGIGLTPQYVPSASDFNLTNAPNGVNVITITLNGTSNNGCSADTDSLQLTLYAKPIITAGVDLEACEGTTSALLNGAAILNSNADFTVTWSSSDPAGTWDYSNSNGGINPTYIFNNNLTLLKLIPY